MARLGDETDFSYRVNKVTKVVDGDTIDVILDMVAGSYVPRNLKCLKFDGRLIITNKETGEIEQEVQWRCLEN